MKVRPESIRSSTTHTVLRGEIDLFAVYCPALDTVYALPVDDVPANLPALSVEPPGNQSVGIRWPRTTTSPA